MSAPRPPSAEAARGCIQVLAWQCENELRVAHEVADPAKCESELRAAALSQLAIDVAWFIERGVFE